MNEKAFIKKCVSNIQKKRFKYFVYSSIKRDGTAYLPNDAAQAKILVESYNNYLNSLMNEIKSKFIKEFSDMKNQHIDSKDIFKKLNLIRY